MKEIWESASSICRGDIVRFEEPVYSGSYRKAKFIGKREITGRIIKESYGKKKQQHTFSIEVLNATGTQSDDVLNKKRICRKGRNIYPTCERLRGNTAFENERQVILEEKHERGKKARAERNKRINEKCENHNWNHFDDYNCFEDHDLCDC